jgi:hypothetical protein
MTERGCSLAPPESVTRPRLTRDSGCGRGGIFRAHPDRGMRVSNRRQPSLVESTAARSLPTSLPLRISGTWRSLASENLLRGPRVRFALPGARFVLRSEDLGRAPPVLGSTSHDLDRATHDLVGPSDNVGTLFRGLVRTLPVLERAADDLDRAPDVPRTDIPIDRPERRESPLHRR